MIQISLQSMKVVFLLRDVTIITRHASASIGTKLVFDGEGQVSSRVPCPRAVKIILFDSNYL